MSPSNEKTYESLSYEICIQAVQRAYQEEGRIGQTVRHYYYKLLSSGAIRLLPRPKSGANAYSFASRLLTDARKKGRLPWSAVIDPGRRHFAYPSYTSLSEYVLLESQSGFRLDPWRGQPRRVEVWVEKDAMADFVNREVRDYRIPVYVNKGYASATLIKDAADRYGSGKGCTLLYAGDFDPSGLNIEETLHEALRSHGSRPHMVRVTLTQADTFSLPQEAALELKETDTRTKHFRATYGQQQKGYELDALPAGDLHRKLQEAIATFVDLDTLHQALRLEYEIQQQARTRLEKALRGFEEEIFDSGVPGNPLSYVEQIRYLVEPDVYAGWKEEMSQSEGS